MVCTMKKITIIKPRWILTVNEQFDLLTDSALIIENDIIQSILPVSELHTVEGLDEAEVVSLTF